MQWLLDALCVESINTLRGVSACILIYWPKFAGRGKKESVTEGELMNVMISPLAYAYARTLQGFCIFCCHKCHTFWVTPCYCAGYLRFVMLFDTFAENDGLFCWKRRVVLSKTTACFAENDVLFFLRERRSCETYGKMEKQNGVKRQIVLGCVTLVIAKSEKSL